MIPTWIHRNLGASNAFVLTGGLVLVAACENFHPVLRETFRHPLIPSGVHAELDII